MFGLMKAKSSLYNSVLKDSAAGNYSCYHAPRYEVLLDVTKREYSAGSTVLDIGRSLMTSILAKEPDVTVDTLGFEPDGATKEGNNYYFDLTASQEISNWRDDLGPYDLVVFAEVIEHLPISPLLVLGFLNSLTSQGGKIILQTPNAVSLHKRIWMLLGHNPYEKIREDNKNPGHFREYTKAETIDYARDAGFEVSHFLTGNYFDYRYSTRSSSGRKSLYRLINWVYSVCPSSLRPGMTFVLVKV